MQTHKLKTWPAYWEETYYGRKDFDLRKDDRGFRIGDFLFLVEWDQRTGEETGRVMQRVITGILYGGPRVEGKEGLPDPTGALAEGYVILSHAYVQAGWRG